MLEEDLIILRRKYRKLEQRVLMLEGSLDSYTRPTKAKHRRSENDLDTPPERAPVNEKPAAVDSKDHNILSEENILNAVQGMTSAQNIFKTLCLKVFSRDEIVGSTRTGKRTHKCMDNVKPALSTTKFAFLQSIISKAIPTMDKTTILKKFQNVQKVLRRERKRLKLC